MTTLIQYIFDLKVLENIAEPFLSTHRPVLAQIRKTGEVDYFDLENIARFKETGTLHHLVASLYMAKSAHEGSDLLAQSIDEIDGIMGEIYRNPAQSELRGLLHGFITLLVVSDPAHVRDPILNNLAILEDVRALLTAMSVPSPPAP